MSGMCKSYSFEILQFNERLGDLSLLVANSAGNFETQNLSIKLW